MLGEKIDGGKDRNRRRFMKKSKFLALGLIALMLIGGLVLVSCSACPGVGGKDKGSCNLDYKTLGDAGKAKQCEDGCITSQVLSAGTSAVGSKFDCDC